MRHAATLPTTKVCAQSIRSMRRLKCKLLRSLYCTPCELQKQVIEANIERLTIVIADMLTLRKLIIHTPRYE